MVPYCRIAAYSSQEILYKRCMVQRCWATDLSTRTRRPYRTCQVRPLSTSVAFKSIPLCALDQKSGEILYGIAKRWGVLRQRNAEGKAQSWVEFATQPRNYAARSLIKHFLQKIEVTGKICTEPANVH